MGTIESKSCSAAADGASTLLTLYKFRPLANCLDLSRAEAILQTGKFWCSRFWDLNDPMEGVYSSRHGDFSDDDVKRIYEDKSSLVLCSFSADEAFSLPIIWGYYANGFRGIAIEMEVPDTLVEKVIYEPRTQSVAKGDAERQGKEILKRKHKCWAHEEEWRYIKRALPGYHCIGRISAVHFGRPYERLTNTADIHARSVIREYQCRVKALECVARDQGIACRDARIEDGVVVSTSQHA